MMFDQCHDLVREISRNAQTREKRACGFDARPIMCVGTDSTLHLPGRCGFAQIVAKHAPHHGFSLPLRALTKRGGLIQGHQRVGPDVALGMPDRVLGYVDQSREFGKVGDQSARTQKREAPRRRGALEQKLAELFLKSLARKLRKIELTTAGDECRVYVHFEACAQLCHTNCT